MEYTLDTIPNDFILDISTIPDSSDEVCHKAIEHYMEKSTDDTLPVYLKQIASAIAGNLMEYYSMSSYDSKNLRGILPHLTASFSFLENKHSFNLDVESTARIKSFYSAYLKIIEKVTDCVQRDKPVPTSGLLKDIYGTRVILHPRNSMKNSPQAFYKVTYRTILEHLEFIDALHEQNPEYDVIELSDKKRRELRRPVLKKYSNGDPIYLPEHDFMDYVMSFRNVPHAYRYLAEYFDSSISAQLVGNVLQDFQKHDLTDINYLKSSPIYLAVKKNSETELDINLRNHFEEILIHSLSPELLSDYKSSSADEFLSKYKGTLTTYTKDVCNFISYMDRKIDSNIDSPEEYPQFENKYFIDALNLERESLSKKQIESINKELQELHSLGLSDFSSNLKMARKLKKFDRASKDYMINPKSTGYQSFHVLVQTPFGPYEIQFRTADQDRVAEHGPASHSKTYKKDVKDTFHRLKIPTAIVPKRDLTGEIIYPFELGVAGFLEAIRIYHKKPFEDFSGGKTLKEIQEENPSKEEFDLALFNLSPVPTVSKNLMTKIRDFFVPKTKRTQPTVKALPSPAQNIASQQLREIPEDIAADSKIFKRPLEIGAGSSTHTEVDDSHDGI